MVRGSCGGMTPNSQDEHSFTGMGAPAWIAVDARSVGWRRRACNATDGVDALLVRKRLTVVSPPGVAGCLLRRSPTT